MAPNPIAFMQKRYKKVMELFTALYVAMTSEVAHTYSRDNIS